MKATQLYTTFTDSGQIVGERGGTAFTLRFWRRNTVPLAYTMTATYSTYKMCVTCMI